jgi:hypothetical protein
MTLMPIPRTPTDVNNGLRGSADEEIGSRAIRITAQEINTVFDVMGVRGDTINRRESMVTATVVTTSVSTDSPGRSGLIRCPGFGNLAAYAEDGHTQLAVLFKYKHLGCLCNNLSVQQRQFPKVDLL